MSNKPTITNSHTNGNSRVSGRLRKFFANRAPRSDQNYLSLRTVYVFFSRSGLFYALLLVITFIMGINYGNNLVLGLCFYLASIWVISFHLTFLHIFGLHINLTNTPLLKAGDIGYVTIDVVNDKSKPSRQLNLVFDRSLVEDDLSDKSSATKPVRGKRVRRLRLSSESEWQWQQQRINPNVHITSLQGSKQVQLPIMAHKRGRMDLPRLIVSTVYPMGIMRAWSYVYFASPVWVYPKPAPFDLVAAHVTSQDDDHALSLRNTTGQNDFESLDEYAEGESLGRVSWAHVARGQGMLTKHFADTIGREQLIDYNDMPANNHEDRLSQLSYAVLKIGETGGAFQLNLPNDTGSVGQGAAYVDACLMRLAKCP